MCTALRKDIFTSVGQKFLSMSYFINPVTPDVAPDYRTFIDKPICLSDIETKIKKGQYETPESFDYDMMSIFDNANLYNSLKYNLIMLEYADAGLRSYRKLYGPWIKKIQDKNVQVLEVSATISRGAMGGNANGSKFSLSSKQSAANLSMLMGGPAGGGGGQKRALSPMVPSSSSSGNLASMGGGGGGGGKRMRLLSPGASLPTTTTATTTTASTANSAAAAAAAAFQTTTSSSIAPSSTLSSLALPRSRSSALFDVPSATPPPSRSFEEILSEVMSDFVLREDSEMEEWERECMRFLRELKKHPWLNGKIRPKGLQVVFNCPVVQLWPEMEDAYLEKVRAPNKQKHRTKYKTISSPFYFSLFFFSVPFTFHLYLSLLSLI